MLFDILKNQTVNKAFLNPCEEVRRGVPTAVFNVSFSHKCHFASLFGERVLLIVKDLFSLEKTKEEIESISGKKVVCLYPKDDVLVSRRAFMKQNLYKKISALCDIKRGAEIIVTTPDALMQIFPKNLPTVDIKKGDSFELDEVIKTLSFMGYKREDRAIYQGCFSVIGDVLEVFPINSDNPYRIDFFGDEVENIRLFDINVSKSIGNLESLFIPPATDVFISKEEKESLLKKLSTSVKNFTDKKAFDRAKEIQGEIVKNIDSLSGDCLSALLPVSESAKGSITDYIKEGTVVIFDEPKALSENAAASYKEHLERYENLLKGGEVFDFSKDQLCPFKDVISGLIGVKICSVSAFSAASDLISPIKIFSLKAGVPPKYRANFEELSSDVSRWIDSGYKVYIATETEKKARTLKDFFGGKKIPCAINEDIENEVSLITEKLPTGFIYHESKSVVLGSGDVFLETTKEKTYKKRQDFFEPPAINDYAVHETHGIGLTRGVKRISSFDEEKDYVVLEYDGGDVLYVPVDRLDVLSKYVGGDKKPKLSKLGGKDFEKTKQKVLASIKELSIDLKALYAKRLLRQGFLFKDGEEFKLFESDFPYPLTGDQQKAISDIKSDMCSKKVMDRLVCGDVGYGKTEVAFEAAFLAMMSNKQVCMIAPTTILTQQHYNTAVERFKNFGVNIGLLNRFKTKKEQKKILEDLACGKIDFIIGTHRLFGEDVKFKDLGLLILDEEQRFGVEHKEKIKTLKENVDTITLTATPIPRTLHMSLSGIRDISVINTPPKERIPVQTVVTEESEVLIADAIKREVSRGGQAFVLFNRVVGIESFAYKIKNLLPDVSFIVAHGQMQEEKLEKTVMDFYAGKYDVLISTTIIENGIDLPRANTIIVIDADNLGLSSLYQLKGRVGRSNKTAYAIFTFKRDKVLTENAYKRLSALMEFAEMGSGIKIAMRDLEIRGAGNVLGREQHGHMDKIGYELYSKLLREETGEEENHEIDADIKITAFIPDDYVGSSSGRMDIYKEIAEIKTDKDEEEVKRELISVYGKIPPETENLFLIVRIRRLSGLIGAISVKVGSGIAKLTFSKLSDLNSPVIKKATERYYDRISYDLSKEVAIKFAPKSKSNAVCCAYLTEFLEFCEKERLGLKKSG